MFREPPFRVFPPYLQLLGLLVVVLTTGLLVMAVGTGVGMIIFGKDVLQVLSQAGSLDDPATVAALKYFQVVNQFGVFILPAILFVFLTDDDMPGYLRFRGSWKPTATLLGVVLIIVSLPLNQWLALLNESVSLPSFLDGVEKWMMAKEAEAEDLTNAFLSSTSVGGLLFNLFMVAALAAIGEELIFRGILVRIFREWTGNVHLAVILPALLFSAMHLQFYGFLPRTLLAVFLGYLFVWTGSLKVPVVVHFVNNALAVFIAFMDQRGWIDADFEQVGSSENPWVIGGSIVLTLAVLWIIYRREHTPVGSGG